ncbi:hypothetical protein Btru_063807 [Bulinus truncatus]|nr:hypothetical protein Btru_063807 [Bulinus truncatus]
MAGQQAVFYLRRERRSIFPARHVVTIVVSLDNLCGPTGDDDPRTGTGPRTTVLSSTGLDHKMHRGIDLKRKKKIRMTIGMRFYLICVLRFPKTFPNSKSTTKTFDYDLIKCNIIG